MPLKINESVIVNTLTNGKYIDYRVWKDDFILLFGRVTKLVSLFAF